MECRSHFDFSILWDKGGNIHKYHQSSEIEVKISELPLLPSPISQKESKECSTFFICVILTIISDYFADFS